MGPTLREMRIESLKVKIAACQQECSELNRKSAEPYLTVEERAAISRLQGLTIRECHNLRHMLGLYDPKTSRQSNHGLSASSGADCPRSDR